MTESRLKSLVNFGDLLAAVKSICGTRTSISDYHVAYASENITGLTSLLLRVRVITRSPAKEISFIVKRSPTLQKLTTIVTQCELFTREIAFFSKAIPVLKKKCGEVPICKSYVEYGSTLLLEDLCASGYELFPSDKPLGLSHLKLIMRKLAQLHVASLNEEWRKIIPEKFLDTDGLTESGDGTLFRFLFENVNKFVLRVIEKIYPAQTRKFRDWFTNPESYSKFVSIFKPQPNFLNVLCHGDFWVNNIMFKFDPNTKEPLDVKFVDLQLFRFASGSTDIMNILYSCLNRPFRDEHLNEILRAYVGAFNAYACVTPDRLPYENFLVEFEHCLMAGLYMGLAYRPMGIHVGEVLREQTRGEVTEQVLEVVYGDRTEQNVRMFWENELFREEMMGLIDELMEVLERRNGWLIGTAENKEQNGVSKNGKCRNGLPNNGKS